MRAYGSFFLRNHRATGLHDDDDDDDDKFLE